MNPQPLKLGCSYVQNTVKELSLDLEKKKMRKYMLGLLFPSHGRTKQKNFRVSEGICQMKLEPAGL